MSIFRTAVEILLEFKAQPEKQREILSEKYVDKKVKLLQDKIHDRLNKTKIHTQKEDQPGTYFNWYYEEYSDGSFDGMKIESIYEGITLSDTKMIPISRDKNVPLIEMLVPSLVTCRFSDHSKKTYAASESVDVNIPKGLYGGVWDGDIYRYDLDNPTNVIIALAEGYENIYQKMLSSSKYLCWFLEDICRNAPLLLVMNNEDFKNKSIGGDKSFNQLINDLLIKADKMVDKNGTPHNYYIKQQINKLNKDVDLLLDQVRHTHKQSLEQQTKQSLKQEPEQDKAASFQQATDTTKKLNQMGQIQQDHDDMTAADPSKKR